MTKFLAITEVALLLVLVVELSGGLAAQVMSQKGNWATAEAGKGATAKAHCGGPP